ncbi:MAG: restriction endonuclease subunit S, partial [Coriobacteriia bacterium]|nr:restriction endonuclease subunit S [Coriobacteriia bacterium]
MSENLKTAPDIRFKGFTDAWEQRKASKVFIIIDERGYSELAVLSATQDQGMIYREDSGRNIEHDIKNVSNYKRVIPGSFVIHLRSFQGGFAHSPISGITSPAYTVFAPRKIVLHSDRFWKHWFSSESFVRSLQVVIYGIRDGRSINISEFMQTFQVFPIVEEQTEIGDFFDGLDNLITLHQR